MSNEPAVRGYVVGPGEGVPDRTPDVKASGRSTGGSVTVMELAVDGGPPRHTHTREDETLYVLEGAITAYVGDQQFEVEAGSYAALPNKVRHGFSVRGEEARLLITLAPAGVEYFFVPRNEADQDESRYGIIFEERVPAAA